MKDSSQPGSRYSALVDASCAAQRRFLPCLQVGDSPGPQQLTGACLSAFRMIRARQKGDSESMLRDLPQLRDCAGLGGIDVARWCDAKIHPYASNAAGI